MEVDEEMDLRCLCVARYLLLQDDIQVIMI